MLGGAVAFVVGETVSWVCGVGSLHEGVTVDFGDDGSGGDGFDEAVAFNNGFVGKGKVFDWVAVDKNELRLGFEVADCAFHGKIGSVANVEAVDFFDRCLPYCPGMGGGFDFFGEVFALRFGEGFGIADEGDAGVEWEDDCGGEDRSRKATTANFINTSDQGDALGDEFAFVLESWGG